MAGEAKFKMSQERLELKYGKSFTISKLFGRRKCQSRSKKHVPLAIFRKTANMTRQRRNRASSIPKLLSLEIFLKMQKSLRHVKSTNVYRPRQQGQGSECLSEGGDRGVSDRRLTGGKPRCKAAFPMIRPFGRGLLGRSARERLFRDRCARWRDAV